MRDLLIDTLFFSLGAALIALLFLELASCARIPQESAPIVVETGTTAIQDENIGIGKGRYSNQFNELLEALKASKQNIELKEIVLAQWILESARGNSSLARLHYNFGGLKWRSEMSVIATSQEHKAHDGITRYCKFKSASDYVKGYWHFINRYPYIGWDKHKLEPVKFIQFIVKSGYCPDQGYVANVLKLVNEAKELLK